MIDLRPYQAELVANASRALKVHRRVLIQSATGSGKTALASKMMSGCVDAGWSQWFVCHRDELIQQTSRTLIRGGVDHSYIAAGYPRNYQHQVQVGMVGTIGRRLEKLSPPKIIFLDEAHHAVAGTWRKIIDQYPEALIVGLSATPQRLDGRGLDDVFNAIVPGPQTRWLMDQGWLSDYRAWTHAPPDLSGLKRRGSDFDPEELAAKMSDSRIVGDAVEHYLEICPGERGVAFCVNVDHAIRTRDAFVAAGVRAEMLDGATPKDVRRKVLDAFRAGEVDIITSVDLFGEGFDLPEMSVAILMRPTDSLSLFLQQCGRPMRPVWAPGYELETVFGRLKSIANGSKPYSFLLDHAGNIARHGLPDAYREWTLEGRKKSSGVSSGPAPKQCAKCFGANPSGTKVCRYCGFTFILTPREIEIDAGQLQEIQREAIRAGIASTPADEAATYEELVGIYMARGHNDPATAAEGAWKKRGPITESQFLQACHIVAKARGYKPGWADYKRRLRNQRLMRTRKTVAA